MRPDVKQHIAAVKAYYAPIIRGTNSRVDFNSPCPIRQQLMSNSPCAPRFTSILERRSTVLGGTRAAKIPVVASASHEPLGRIEIAMRLGALEL